MNLAEIFGIGGGAAAIVLTLLQISPIRIDPWSMIFRAIGRALNKDTLQAIHTLSESVDQNEIDRLRWEILDFANSCQYRRGQSGNGHTQEEYAHIIRMHQKYETILERRHEKNGQVDLAYQYIETLYKKCQSENDFI